MSTTVTTLNSTRISAAALAAIFTPVAALLASWRARTVDRRQLASLDGHMLRDIGLSLGDVDSEVNKPFWRG